jgi:gliding motility-associated-like protein
MNQAGGVRNFMASFMATEDNTTVILSEYDTGVVFESLAGNITDDVQTFNLNAGESVTVSGYTDFSPNLTGFVGALLTSTKPIVVNTGNATGGMSTPTAGQDFNLDQIVPVNIVGDEYIVVKGNGSDLHERPLIIATQDNTQVFINGNTTAAATLLNAGDYFLVPSSFYSGTVNQNMFISSDKPVYLYQIIAGAISDATSGLNFIPPLSCFWQKNVDLIPNFNSIGSTNYPNSEIIVVTETGSTVSINNVPTTATPQLVTGNPNWVTYRINGLSGNVKIESTGALAAGVFGASGAAGFGGYYSGFGSLPRNTEVTVCSNETVNLFDAITGNPEPNGTWTIPTGAQPLNGNDFTGTINTPGDYIYTFSKICDNSNLVIPVTVTVNVEQAPFVGTNNLFSICKNDTSVDLFTLLGTGVTTGGTWSPALASGTGMFNPAIDVSGTYTYTIQGNAICPNVSATITVTNNDFPVITPISNFELCDDAADGNDTNGSVNFDLTLKNSEILGSQTGITVTYHLDPNEALNGQNAITNLNTSNRIIHVRLTNNVTGCFSTTSFNLVVKPLPIVNAVVALKQCDIDSDAVTDFNLTQANIKISTDATFVYSYHNSPLGALNNTDFVTNEIVFNAGNGSQVWARITNTLGCSRVAQVNLIVSATTIPQTYSYTIPACDDYLSASDPDNDGIDYFDLTEIEPLLLIQFPSGQSYTYSYYLNEADATAEQNPIINITNFRNTLPNNQTIWVRIESTLYECAGLGPFLKLVVNPLPFIDLGENFVLCIDAVTGLGSQTINATPSTPGSYSYQWTPTNPSGNFGLYNVTAAGTYAVVVTNTNTGCQFTDSVSVTTSSAPASLSVVLTTPAFSSGLATIEAIATGGFGIYEYSLNALDWQSSPIFSGLENGSYTVYARDIQGCDLLVSDAIQTITYPNYFTPNGDGYNDTWVIRLPSEYNGLITIYDRYGKLIKQISSYGAGWDGTFNGIALPSTDYWFKVEYTENNKRKEFKSHFSLKR